MERLKTAEHLEPKVKIKYNKKIDIKKNEGRRTRDESRRLSFNCLRGRKKAGKKNNENIKKREEFEFAPSSRKGNFDNRLF